MNDDERKITVCANCKRASCWHGLFGCDHYLDADIVEMSIGELKKLNLEHPSYWELEEVP